MVSLPSLYFLLNLFKKNAIPVKITKKSTYGTTFVGDDELIYNEKNITILNKFRRCLVCPERWGRPYDIAIYKKRMQSLSFDIDAVMTSNHYAPDWLK